MPRYLLLPSVCALALIAQSSRDAYRSAYATWRQADPNLEKDAASSSPQLVGRIARAAQEAAGYYAARTAFLRTFSQQVEESAAPLRSPLAIEADLSGGRDLRALASMELKTTEATMKVLDGDKDAGITRVRQAMDRERAALAALEDSIDARAAAVQKVAAIKAEESREKALTAYEQVSAAIKDAAGASDQESAMWAKYYRSLSPAAR